MPGLSTVKNNNRTAGKLNQNLVEFMTSLCQTL